ncbi:precorrin-6y C5,15-methyltransferase (decarboxylating) subunit CbiE [Antarcticirhabdus aurantiaca]|uniref:Precorrin-6y C5,15-methyltransferase (Decarboxylating) subunit CbiE n=1 Tax=Antarcticirhabdus aurantiaca TaxID=2606717 RepID=A0ACD4NHR3_9HYPH|nr:precorrin-6y C5,15-methyltransferase (decarboxylating) subunit CbiE [Antarcticirhabdus aurantiaca]WAJ26337.1 precorrin-6y C5,15-methyltransferase (decarboxylating) subunit CbiE [Jeongeuplla avenae]
MASSEDGAPPATPRWLAVVGIGEDGVAGLSDRAKALIAGAEAVFGGERHLQLAAPLVRGDARSWPKPFDAGMAAVRAMRGRRTCVLASGDPFLFGVGATLARQVPAEEMDVVPAPSAFSLAAARLGWALQDVATVSLHGRPIALLRPHLQPGARVLALTSDENGPMQAAALLERFGFGGSRVTVLEALGGERERISRHRAADLAGFAIRFDPLNLLAIEVRCARDAKVLSLSPGLCDDVFEHDGQITKRLVRAMTLATLAPRRGERLWDVGAGSGSIAIEWMLRDPSLSAVAIEARPDRAAAIRRNAEALGVPGLAVVEGKAPAALAGLPPPDAIFLGGGGSKDGLLDAAIAALPPGGRLVANAVTLEMEAALAAARAAHGGSLDRIALASAEPVGGMTGWRPAMPVTQWAWVKP